MGFLVSLQSQLTSIPSSPSTSRNRLNLYPGPWCAPRPAARCPGLCPTPLGDVSRSYHQRPVQSAYFSTSVNTRRRGPCWSPTPAADAWVKGLVPRTWCAPRPVARCPGLCPTPLGDVSRSSHQRPVQSVYFAAAVNTRRRGPCWIPTPTAEAWVKGLVPRPVQV